MAKQIVNYEFKIFVDDCLDKDMNKQMENIAKRIITSLNKLLLKNELPELPVVVKSVDLDRIVVNDDYMIRLWNINQNGYYLKFELTLFKTDVK